MKLSPNNIYKYESLHSTFEGYGGISFQSASTAVHQHADFYELILITEGEWQNRTKALTNTMTTGTLALFKPGVVHQLFTEPFESTHFVICIEQTFFEDFLKRVFPTFDIDSLSDCTSKALGKEKTKYIEYLGTTLVKNSRPSPSTADEILFLCISDFAYRTSTLNCDAHVADIIEKLNNQLYMYTSVEEICAQYPYSKPMLLRQFKRLTGYTIVEYKAQQKMKHACSLLAKSELKIIDIAVTLGYDSLSYFLRAFKKQYGITPSEYRKLHKATK